MYQIVNFFWKHNSVKYNQFIGLRDLDTDDYKSINLESYKFNYVLSPERYCVGYFKDHKYIPCKFNNELSSKTYERCAYCEDKFGFKASFLFGKEPNEQMKKYLGTDHIVYLSYFSSGEIKVGTASATRQKERPIEQDAMAYVVFAKVPNASIARELEVFVTKNLNVKEFVKSRSKLNSIENRIDFKKAKELINTTLDKINAKINSSELASYLEKDPEIIDLSKNYYYPDVKPVKMEGQHLVGEFLGLRGKFILISNGGNRLIFDIRTLVGRSITNYIDEYVYSINIDERLSFL